MQKSKCMKWVDKKQKAKQQKIFVGNDYNEIQQCIQLNLNKYIYRKLFKFKLRDINLQTKPMHFHIAFIVFIPFICQK